jgi:anaerobic magnesium-protoporphyrin IX monomethyl ester cyclase
MKTKLLLISPYLEKIVEPIYDVPDFIRPSLAYLAGYIRENGEYDIMCVDAKFSKKSLDDLIFLIRNFYPDIVGISAYTYEIKEVKILSERIKKEFPHIMIILGGSHITALPRKTLEEIPEIDIGVIGEGEETLLMICDFFSKKKDFSNIPGIVYRGKNKIITRRKKENIDLSRTPLPAWDLFPPANEYYIQTSRGCPFNCDFCFNPNGRIIRNREIKDVIKEIVFLIDNFKPKRISFGDEIFGVEKKRVHSLLDKMISLNISGKVSWDFQTHVSTIDDEILYKMKEAGVSKIELGVESGNEEILKKMGKNIDKKKIIWVFSKLNEYKIKSGAFFILGHPYETKKTIWDTIKFAAILNPDEPIFSIIVPFPGTKIFEYATKKEKGYLNLSEDWSTYRKQINSSIELANIPNRKLKQYLVIANVYFFVYNLRFLDFVKFIFRYRYSVVSFFKNIKNGKPELS